MELKLRMWILKNKEMKPVDLIEMLNGKVFKVAYRYGANNLKYFDPWEVRLMRSTQIVDEMGDEIYENDIISGLTNSRPYVKKSLVVWCHRRGDFRLLDLPISEARKISVLLEDQHEPKTWEEVSPHPGDLQKLHTIRRPVIMGSLFVIPWVAELSETEALQFASQKF